MHSAFNSIQRRHLGRDPSHRDFRERQTSHFMRTSVNKSFVCVVMENEGLGLLL